MKIQSRPEALDERHRATLRTTLSAEVACALNPESEDHPGEDTQDGGHQGRIVSQAITERIGQGQDPLAHGDSWEDAVDQMRRGIRHSPAATGTTHAPFLTRVRDQPVQTAVSTVNTKETSRQDATIDELAKLPLH